MGGKSIEREVSFNSGRTICDHLDSNKYTVIPIFQTEVGTLYILPWHFLHRGKIADFRHRLDAEGTRITWDGLKKTVDFVYIAVHGRYAEDGTLQGMLEVLGIPYLGTKVLGSATGMDKALQKEVLKNHGIDVPKGIVIHPHEQATLSNDILMARLDAENITLPCIVKPIHEGSSMGISVVFTPEQLLMAVIDAMHVTPITAQSVLIEERVKGMEFTCIALQQIGSDEWFTLPPTEVAPEQDTHFYTYDQKYMPGRATKITPARCSQSAHAKIAEVCIQATKALNFTTISRIDGFLTPDERVIIIDPNTLSGMAPSGFLFHQAAEYGMSHSKLINFLIERELVQYGMISMPSADIEKENVMSTQKKRIAVLLGGDSNEREISFESGRNVCYKLSSQKYTVIPVFVNDKMELYKLDQRLLIKNSTREVASSITPDMFIEWSDLPTLCDFVFIGLHGGKGENGAVQGTLEMLDLPYNGSGVLASALCMDKFQTNNFLRTKGFAVPASLILDKKEWLELATESKESHLNKKLGTVTYPVIVKPHDDGCSVMVHKADSLNQLITTLDEFFASNKTQAMVEEFVRGVELTCGVFGNNDLVALPASMAVAKGGVLSIEEKFLPGAGENQTPAPIAAEAMKLVHETMKAAYLAVGCKGYARIDCFYQEAHQNPTGQPRVVVLEFNTLPALTPATCLFHQAAEVGMRPMELMDKIIELGFELHRKETIKPVHHEDEPAAPVSQKHENTETLQAKMPADFIMKMF